MAKSKHKRNNAKQKKAKKKRKHNKNKFNHAKTQREPACTWLEDDEYNWQ